MLSFSAASFKALLGVEGEESGFSVPDASRILKEAELDASRILKEAEQGLSSLKRYLGVEKEEPTMCDLFAVPFIHGAAISPEIHRLQSQLGDFLDADQLERAHAQLLQVKEHIPGATEPLEALREAGLCTDDVHDLVLAQLRRETDAEGRRQRFAEDARRAAINDRAAFEERMAVRMRTAEEAASRAVAEGDPDRPVGATRTHSPM
jgi:hypothetical protein